MTFAPVNSESPFLPTSQVFPEDESQLLIVHTDVYNAIAQRLNLRQIGTFDKVEQVAGQFFFNDTNQAEKRLSYRQVYSFGSILANTSIAIAHNIDDVNSTTTFTHIYGSCVTDTIDNRPIPYASTGAIGNQIEINVDATDINILNGAIAPDITSGIVVLEYLKN